jgi:hypothetical protein
VGAVGSRCVGRPRRNPPDSSRNCPKLPSHGSERDPDEPRELQLVLDPEFL